MFTGPDRDITWGEPAVCPGWVILRFTSRSVVLSARMTVDAVVFDLDDTLIFEEDVARTSFRKVADLIGCKSSGADELMLARARKIWRAGPHWPTCVKLGFASWEGLWADFDGCHPSLNGLRAWIPQYRREAWRLSLIDVGVSDEDLAIEAEEAYREFQRAGHSPRPGADELLLSLRGSVRLGLLTNGPPDVQRFKLARCGLDGRFNAVAISGEIGHGKPDPAAFAVILEKLGVRSDRSVMVGDSWERDVMGARLAGMHSVWVSGGRPPPEPRSGVKMIASVADLTPDLLQVTS